MSFITFDLAELIRSCTSIYSYQMRERKLNLLLELDERIGSIHTDPDRLKQVMMTFLGNAVNFTHDGFIKVSASLEEKDLIQISVCDTGIGIAPDTLQEI
jgi:two-component system sensor histidine kinase VicK